MTVDQERLALGTAALRSGEYPQDRGCLRSRSGYCCLGVLTEVAIANGLKGISVNPGSRVWSYNGESALLLQAVADWYGLDSDDPALRAPDGTKTSCIEANDSCEWNFDQIADALERTYGPEGIRNA